MKKKKAVKSVVARIGKRSKIQFPSSLSRAYDLTKRASRLGFDWPDIGGVLKKMDEEIEELREALSLQDRNKIREEIGDLLFVIVNVARFLRINPEETLEKTIKKFTHDFITLKHLSAEKGDRFTTPISSKWIDYGKKQRVRSEIPKDKFQIPNEFQASSPNNRPSPFPSPHGRLCRKEGKREKMSC